MSNASSRLFDGDDATATLAQAKDFLRVRAKKGAYCPCCKQYVKVYKRVLGSQMARWLIWLVRTWTQQQAGIRSPISGRLFRLEENHPWIDVKQSPVRGGDYAKLVHWNLVEHKANTGDASKRDSGLWRPTHAGIRFVHNQLLVPSHVLLYDNKLLNWKDDSITQINIIDALGKKFDYSELMGSPVNVEVPV